MVGRSQLLHEPGFEVEVGLLAGSLVEQGAPRWKRMVVVGLNSSQLLR